MPQCGIWKREFTEKYSLTRHVKSQHLSCQRCSQTFNRRGNYEMHQRVCMFKTTGKHGTAAKRLIDNTSRVGGDLNGIVNEYRLKCIGCAQGLYVPDGE